MKSHHFEPRHSKRVAMAVALALSASALQVSAAESSAGEEALSEVTVTGSRIVRRDLEAASPVVTVENQAFEQSSTLAVESVLNQLPQFTPANTQFTTTSTAPSATATPGISTVSLRGLGSNRTLVLVDGRRAQPADSTLVIDTNSIPSSALESVEIITGGASAVYGADALAGVTNFKLKSKFEGLDVQVRSGITEEGDGAEHRFSVLMGSSLGDGRGNAMLGIEWTKRDEVLAADRDFFQKALKDPQTNATSAGRNNGFQYEPSTVNAPSQAASNAQIIGEPAGYNVPRTTVFLFNDNGSLYKYERQGIGFLGDRNSPQYKVSPSNQLIQNNLDLRYSSPAERYSLFGKANFKINDAVEAFTQVNFVNTSNRQTLQPTGAVGGFGASIPFGTNTYGPSVDQNGNTRAEYLTGGSFGLNCGPVGGCTNSQAFPVSPALAALLASRGPDLLTNAQTPQATYDPITRQPVYAQGANSNWLLGGTFGFLPARTIENTTNLYQLLAGLRGDLGLGDWTWEAYTSHGGTRTELDYIGFVSTQRWQALATAPNFGRGYNVTGAGQTASRCTTGLPVFGSFAISQDCINALTARFSDRTRLTQDIVELTTQGGLFELPAGEVRAAAGLTWRKNEFQYMPDASREANSIFDIPVGAFGQANVFGETTVKEAYGELLVPVVRDVFLVRKLELELGYRFSEYDSGSVPTWKALFSWEPIDWARLRGGFQLANRAPNINELFLDASANPAGLRAGDPCRADTRESYGNLASNPNRAQIRALCSALAGGVPVGEDFAEGRADGVLLQVSSGNTALRSEEGKTWTMGVVLSSPFEAAAIAGTTLSLDWYRTKITDAIATINAQSAYDLCFNRDGVSNPTYSIDDPNGVCRNITRDEVNGAAAEVRSQYQNLGIIQTSGLDVNLNWRASLSDVGLASLPGSIGVNFSYNKLFEYKAQDYPTQNPVENKGTLGSGARPALFDWRLVTNVRYINGAWDVGLNWRHLPSIRSFNFVSDPATTVQGAGSYDVFGLSGNWNVTSNFGISGGVDNVFDREPERVGAGQIQAITAANGGGTTVLNGSGSTNAQYYDVLGRRYFINLKLRF